MDGETEKQEFYMEPSDSAAAASLAALRSMQQDGQLCDVVLEAEGGVVCVGHHRLQNLEINVSDRDHLLVTFCKLVHKHPSKIGAASGQDSSVG